MTFKDHFSGHAGGYASFRPRYPEALFDFVARLPASRRLAWDAGTGNGQAALDLAERFERVVATDASAEQLALAEPHPGIEYRQARAEASGLATGSVDLVTVATAVHWFDFDAFYAEVERVLAPGGAVAVWAYFYPAVEGSGEREVQPLLDQLAREIVGPYWPPERSYVNEKYGNLPFPFREVPAPTFFIENAWTLPRFLAYLQTWSAYQRYVQANGVDPIDLVRHELEARWGDPEVARELRWEIFVRAGRSAR